jgi:4-hydroxy-tetrahydrodipicolinate reductase
VVAYAAAANLRPLEAVNDMVSILCAGKNVLSCWVVPLVYPDAVDPAFTDPLREAALAGGVSFFTTGIDSGFANDVLPLALSGVARTIDSIRVTEMFNYATYPDATAVYDILGFGKAPEESRSRRHRACSPSAGGRYCTSWPTASPLMRSTLTGYVDSDPTFVLDHVSRMHDDIAPDWPQPHISIQPRDFGYGGASGQGVYRVEIEGHPACAANSRWPTTMITISARGWPELPGWSTRFRRSAPRNRVSCRHWTCH